MLWLLYDIFQKQWDDHQWLLQKLGRGVFLGISDELGQKLYPWSKNWLRNLGLLRHGGLLLVLIITWARKILLTGLDGMEPSMGCTNVGLSNQTTPILAGLSHFDENRARPQPSLTSNGRFKNENTKLIDFTYTMRRHWMLTWKTKTREKPQEPTDSEMSTMRWELQWQRWRQWPRALSLPQQAVTTETRSVTNSLSLSHALIV